MGQRLWTEESLKEAAEALRGHSRLIDALPEISKIAGFEVSSDAVGNAFFKHGMGRPSQYLNADKKRKRSEMAPVERAASDSERKQENAADRNIGRTQYIAERLAEAVSALPTPTFRINPIRQARITRASEPEAIILDLSDIQIGSKVDAKENGGLNEHTFEIFLDKLGRWTEQTIALIEERLAISQVSVIMLSLIGDIVDGQSIYATHPFEIDRLVLDQLIHGSDALSRAFVTIRKTFPSIPLRMLSVAGNHGRIGKYGESPLRCNWDTVLAHFVKLQMEKAGAAPDEFHIPDTWYALVDLFGQTHLFAHGDAVNTSMGVPIAQLKTYLLKHSQMLGRTVNWAHHGHWHAEATVATSQGGILINGNFVGTNAFSARAMVEGGVPLQMAYGFNRSCGLTWSRKIYLRTREEMKPNPDVRVAG